MSYHGTIRTSAGIILFYFSLFVYVGIWIGHATMVAGRDGVDDEWPLVSCVRRNSIQNFISLLYCSKNRTDKCEMPSASYTKPHRHCVATVER